MDRPNHGGVLLSGKTIPFCHATNFTGFKGLNCKRGTMKTSCCRCCSIPFRVLHIGELKGPFTHAIFYAISDAISRAKRALPYPARMLFSRSIVWIGKKVITYCFKTTFIPISANLVVFCRSVTRLKTRAGLAGAGFVRKIASKSHRNRMKNRMCKRALREITTATSVKQLN